MKQITYSRSAAKTLSRIPADVARRIMAKVAQYAVDPDALANNVKALTGRDGIRLRVGDWRVIMQDGTVLFVIEVGPRGSVYE